MSFHRASEPIENWDALAPWAQLVLEAATRALAARPAKARRA